MKYLKLYESWSSKPAAIGSESKLKEALEIYTEDLSFDISDIKVEDLSFFIPVKSIAPNGGEKETRFRIGFIYLDNDIRSRIDHAEMNDEDLSSSYREFESEIKQLLNPVLFKFAKKYDMKFMVPSLRVDIGDPDIIVWFTLTT
jgi:hypothetical protein